MARGNHRGEPVVEVRVEAPQLRRGSVIGVEIGDMFAVCVVPLILGQVPDDTQSQRRLSFATGAEPPEKAELQEVAQVTCVAILHPSRMPE
jgi:hypothetical protein